VPIYEYRCKNGHTFEVLQSMSDEPVRKCQVCSASVERVFHPVAVHFKGSGFYTTDYGRNRSGAGADKGGESSDSKPASKEPAKAESSSSGSSSSSGDSGSKSSSSSE
jgi:putative FmdB family regulatory protein